MTVVAVLGGPGAPGATSSALALLLSWPLRPGRRVLLAECDPDGGAVLAGALEGRVEAVYGLRNLAVADRRGLLAETLWEQLLDVSPQGTGERLLLPGLTDPAQAPGLAYTWEPLVEALHALEPQGYDVILDLGRSGANGPMAVLARRADVVAATVRTTLRGLSAARPRLAALREDLDTHGTGADGLGLLVIGEGPYPENEVSRQFQLPVVGELAYAPRTARVLSDGGDTADRRFIRSELMRTARTAVDRILQLAEDRRRRLGPHPAAARPVHQPQPQPQLHHQPQPPLHQQPQPQLFAHPQPVQPQPEPPVQQFVPPQPPVQQFVQPQPLVQQFVQPQPVPPQVPQPAPFVAGPVPGQQQMPGGQQAYPGQPQGGQFTGEWPVRADAQPQISYAAPYIAPPAVPQPPVPAPFPAADPDANDRDEDGGWGEVLRAR
ncbi:hypothetical protein [Streptomyces sp. TLI_171]|uniref:hypothetical protein n=1 Tax=Streptomyces sp. TLI_171 TaxID=1938859 RepID=UPI000C581F00|nr:hypothetical protein [Streptomyces sp. TLI_171]RKE22581.1 cellulose biosynthesis protein BcsQ [Streptomyces sp. TLI_171]